MKCERCQNDDHRLMIWHRDKIICRKCIMFSTGLSDNMEITFNESLDAEYQLGFTLSDHQLTMSNKLCQLVKDNQDVLIYAACGSGKTEIILKLIKESLESNLKIGIAIPRKQVVLELSKRLSDYFLHLNVIAVCEGYTSEIYGDLIIATTHQLFRYESYFDILIIDEPDAFPFYNNIVLKNIMKRSVKGNIVYLTATPDDELLQLEVLSLFKRYHGFDVLVPEVLVSTKPILLLKMFSFLKNNKKVLLFVPTINLAKTLSKFLNTFCIHSKSNDALGIIKDFENNVFDVLVCTTILERGVTFSNVNICVLYADHPVFNKSSLIQIAGRVGRKAEYPTGEGIFLCESKSFEVDQCIKDLEMMNA